MLFHGFPAAFLLNSTHEDHRRLETLDAVVVHLDLLDTAGLAARHVLTLLLGERDVVAVNAAKVLDLPNPAPNNDTEFCARFLERAAIAGDSFI